MQLDHPQRNIQIDQIKAAFSMNIMAAGGLVVKLEVGKLWSGAGVFCCFSTLFVFTDATGSSTT